MFINMILTVCPVIYDTRHTREDGGYAQKTLLVVVSHHLVTCDPTILVRSAIVDHVESRQICLT